MKGVINFSVSNFIFIDWF